MAAPITIRIHGDASQLEKTLQGTQKTLGKFGAAVGSFFGNIGANLVSKAPEAIGALFSLGTEIAGAGQKFDVVFGSGGAADSVTEWAQQAAGDMGLTRREAKGLAVDMADLLKPMGATVEQAADMATETIGLAGALSEWSNGQVSATEVSDILTKAMLGERDGLKQLGISISATEVDQRALSLATAAGRTEVTNMDKALATQQLIFEKSTDAQESFALGGDSLQRRSARTRAKMSELKESIAKGLLPVFLAVSKFVVDTLIPAFENFSENIKKFAPAIAALGALIAAIVVPAFIAWAAAAIPAAAATVIAAAPVIALGLALAALAAGIVWAYQNVEIFRTVVDTVFTAVKRVVTVQVALIKIAIDRIVTVVEGVTRFLKNVFAADWGEIWKGIKTTIGKAIDDVVSAVTGMPRRITTAAAGMFDGIWLAFKAAINQMIRAWNNLQFKLPSIDTHIPGIGRIGGFTLGTPNIPTLAHGGPTGTGGLFRVGERGPENVILPGGARVIPAHASGGQGMTFHIENLNTNADPEAIAEAIAWKMRVG